MPSKAEYERLIAETPLFGLSMDDEPSAYKRASLELIGNLYEYLCLVSVKYTDYGLEITETAKDCIHSYNPEKGAFLNYFLASFKKSYQKAAYERKEEDARSGVRIPQSLDAVMRSLATYMRGRNEDGVASDAQVASVAEAIGIQPEQVREALLAQQITNVLSAIMQDENGEEFSLLDIVPDPTDMIDTIASDQACEHLFCKIEELYCDCQRRQKPIISAVMTLRLWNEIKEAQFDTSRFSFIDAKMICSPSPMTQREIAAVFGRDEASISRTISGFTEKLRTRLCMCDDNP